MQLFRGNRLGQIKEGFLADFVVLDADLLTVADSAIKDLRPVLTVSGGTAVFTAAQ